MNGGPLNLKKFSGNQMNGNRNFTLEFAETIKTVKSRLKNYQPVRQKIKSAKPAAVMILFLEVQSQPFLLFTRRTNTVEHHKGQISFPGGSMDPGDASLLETALRETTEEIGIPPKQITVLGESDDFLTNTNFLVRPVVGVLQPPFNFRINHGEVVEVLKVPLSLFLNESSFEIKKWESNGKEYDVYFYSFGPHTIWGVTGYLINRLVDIVFGYNPDPDPKYRDPRLTY